MSQIRDAPTDQDQLGFDSYVSSVAKAVIEIEEDDLPLTIGIFGGWGSGKTSFMMQLERKLKKHSELDMVWFNPWKYDRKDVIWNALVQSVARDLESRVHSTEAKDAAGNIDFHAVSANVRALSIELAALIGPSLFRTAATMFGGPLAGAAADALVQNIGTRTAVDQQSNAHRQDSLDRYEVIEALPKEFDQLVQEYLKTMEKRRLVLFIDDLDRCLPANVVLILEVWPESHWPGFALRQVDGLQSYMAW